MAIYWRVGEWIGRRRLRRCGSRVVDWRRSEMWSCVQSWTWSTAAASTSSRTPFWTGTVHAGRASTLPRRHRRPCRAPCPGCAAGTRWPGAIYPCSSSSRPSGSVCVWPVGPKVTDQPAPSKRSRPAVGLCRPRGLWHLQGVRYVPHIHTASSSDVAGSWVTFHRTYTAVKFVSLTSSQLQLVMPCNMSFSTTSHIHTRNI